MTDAPIKILLIEDDEEDYMITRDILDDIPGGKYELDWATGFEEGIEAIKKNGYSIYLVDYRLGKDDGLDLLKSVRESNNLKCPFIILTGLENREVDLMAMELGAADYLVKSNLTPDLLDRTIRYTIQQAKTIRELKEQQQRLEMTKRIAKIGKWEWDVLADKVDWSDQLYLNLGYEPGSVAPSMEALMDRVFPEDLPTVQQHINTALERKQPYQFEYRIRCPDGSIRYIYEDGRIQSGDKGSLWKIIGTMQDLTDRRSKERELYFKNSVIETAVLPVAFADLNGKITQVNRAFLQAWGYDNLNEVIGMHTVSFSNCREKANVIMKALKQTGSYHGEDEAIRKDGSVFDVYISADVVLDRHDNPIGLQSTFLDITEIKKARRDLEQKNQLIQHLNHELEGIVAERTQELAESQQRLREAQRMARVGHWNVDIDKGELHWSDTLYELVGLDTNTVITKEVELSLIHPEDRKMMDAYLTKARKTGEGEQIDFRVITLQGKELWLQAQVKKYLSDDEGQTHKVFGIVKDITDTKLAAGALQSALNKERHLSQTKSRFVSMASHEFRTPLTTILASIELIEAYADRADTDKQRKHIKRITSAVQNLNSILNDFLSVEKLESNTIELNPNLIEWSLFVQEVISDVSVMCQAGQQIMFTHKGPESLEIDEHLVKNILINLLSNAIKYSPNGKPVKLRSHMADNQLVIEVQDYGIGIPEEEHKKMFSRFYRASNVQDIKGTGLGLSIVKRYLDLMKGTIGFSSVYGEGTTFKVVIPQKVKEIKKMEKIR